MLYMYNKLTLELGHIVIFLLNRDLRTHKF